MDMLTEAEETTLIAPVVNDDNSTFTELYNDYFARVDNYVHYRVDDFHAADDLVSQIFEKLFAKLKYYQPEKAIFSTWLFSIARNTITDYYRSQKRKQVVSLDISPELTDSKPDPIDIVILNETRQHLQKALASLSQRERDIIALKFWSGSSNKAIAEIMGISESNARVILFRAMRRLRIILESQGLRICG